MAVFAFLTVVGQEAVDDDVIALALALCLTAGIGPAVGAPFGIVWPLLAPIPAAIFHPMTPAPLLMATVGAKGD
jgi:hypothetical protein